MLRKAALAWVILLMLTMCLNAKTPENPKEKSKPRPLVTFVELGADSCIPCKMMRPVMETIQKEYGDSISVIFYDITKQREMAMRFNVRVMPTQVFLDKDGMEFHRHEGFYPADQIMKVVDKKLGIVRKNKNLK
jgi:thioredoxin 1